MTSPATTSWQRPLPSIVADRYRVLRLLGAGGMGEAFLAEDTLLHRQVVLKRMSQQIAASEADHARFLSEAKRAAAINNPHVVQIHDVLEISAELLLVLEFVDGNSLRSVRGKLNLDRFFELAQEICDGVAAAHAAHVIHCDLKPENVLLTSSGTVKILDFGLARVSARADAETVSLKQLPKMGGTPGYMAPEMIAEQAVDERADIFALGVIFYELLTGTNPFHAPTLLDTLHRTVHEEAVSATELNPALPAEMDWILAKMLAKDPGERYSSVHDVITDLNTCSRRTHSGASRTHGSLVLIAPKPVRRRYVFIAIVLAASIGLGSGAYWWSHRTGEDGKAARYRSVAVLPFQIIGGQHDGLQAYADGICAMLTSKLARIAEGHRLQVTPSSEVRRLGLTSATAAKQQLGADLVIEGQFQKVGDQVLVTYDLVDTRTMRQLNSRDFQSKLDDSFRLEEQTVSGALELLAIQLETTERQTLGQRGTDNAAAYDLFLTGTGYLREFDNVDNVELAIQSFRRALVLDASYAAASAALGRAYYRKFQLTHDASLVMDARNACEAAVKKNAQLPDSHLCVGSVAAGTGDYDLAVRELERVVSAEPSNDIALRELARVYEHSKKPAEAEQVYRRGIAAQPHYWAGYDWLGAFYVRQARYEEAAQQFRVAIDQAPGNAQLYASLGGIYIYQGKYREAVQSLARAVELRPTPDGYQNLGQAYLHERDFESAIATLKQAVALDDKNYILYSVLGDAYAWSRSHNGEAIAAYQKSNELAFKEQKVNARDMAVNIMLSYNNAALGDETHALEFLNRAQKENPTDAETMFFAARVYARLRYPAESAKWLLRALENGYSKADVKACPDLDGVLSDPRVRAEMAK